MTSSGPIEDIPRSELDRVAAGITEIDLDADVVLRDAARRSHSGGGADRVPIGFLAAVFACAAETSGDAQVGLHVAGRAPLSHWLTYVAESQATLGDAIDSWCRFQEVLFGSRPLRLVRDGVPRLLFQPEADAEAMRHVLEFYVATLCEQVRSWTAGDVRPREIRFAHAPTGDVEEHRRVLSTRVEFGTDLTAVVFSPETLALELPHAHEPIARSLEHMATEELEKLVSPGVEGRARRLLRSALAVGERVDSRTIARRLGISVRTLQRRLAAEGSTFRRLLHDVRRELVGPARDVLSRRAPPSSR